MFESAFKYLITPLPIILILCGVIFCVYIIFHATKRGNRLYKAISDFFLRILFTPMARIMPLVLGVVIVISCIYAPFQFTEGQRRLSTVDTIPDLGLYIQVSWRAIEDPCVGPVKVRWTFSTDGVFDENSCYIESYKRFPPIFFDKQLKTIYFSDLDWTNDDYCVYCNTNSDVLIKKVGVRSSPILYLICGENKDVVEISEVFFRLQFEFLSNKTGYAIRTRDYSNFNIEIVSLKSGKIYPTEQKAN